MISLRWLSKRNDRAPFDSHTRSIAGAKPRKMASWGLQRIYCERSAQRADSVMMKRAVTRMKWCSVEVKF